MLYIQKKRKHRFMIHIYYPLFVTIIFFLIFVLFSSKMTEILNISITSDARDLFIDHDVQTIKKIRETALTEIENKKAVLRNFIGDNYKPVLNTPPVLKEIQTMFDNTKTELSHLSNISRDFSSSEISSEKQTVSPYSEASQSYLQALNYIQEFSFLNAVKLSIAAQNSISKVENRSFVYSSLSMVISSLPSRIYSSMKSYLTSTETKITDQLLIDCFCSVSLLSSFSSQKFEEPLEFIRKSLIERLGNISSQRMNIQDLSTNFVHLLESAILFVSRVEKESESLLSDSMDESKKPKLLKTHKVKFLQLLTQTFANSDINNINECELREIIRYAKSAEDLTRTVLGSPSLVTYLNELKITVNFWQKAFLPIFQKFAKESIKTSIDSLDINKKIQNILQQEDIEKFKAMEFSLSVQNPLDLRSLGLPKEISLFQKEIEELVLLLTSRLQSQSTNIATENMLKQPLISVLQESCTVLQNSISKTPLTVYHLCSALCSPSVCSLLNDDESKTISMINSIQENAATEWSKKKLEQSKYMLQLIPARGAAFSYLVYLEREVLEAAGHINNQILAKNLRNQTRIFVVDFFKEQLNHLESKSGIEAKQAYEKAANLYKDYCLFDFVLSIQSTKMELKSLFIQKMDPIHYQELETKFTLEAQTTFSCSGELLKLISGGNPLKPPTSTPTDMVRLKVEELFSQKK